MGGWLRFNALLRDKPQTPTPTRSEPAGALDLHDRAGVATLASERFNARRALRGAT